jgi:hypothetical protein
MLYFTDIFVPIVALSLVLVISLLHHAGIFASNVSHGVVAQAEDVEEAETPLLLNGTHVRSQRAELLLFSNSLLNVAFANVATGTRIDV